MIRMCSAILTSMVLLFSFTIRVLAQTPTRTYGPAPNTMHRTTMQWSGGNFGAFSATKILFGERNVGAPWNLVLLYGYLEWTFEQTSLPPGSEITAATLTFKTYHSDVPREHASFFLYDVKQHIWAEGGGNEQALRQAMTSENKILDGVTSTINGEQVFTTSDDKLVDQIQEALTSGRNYLTLGVMRNPEFGAGLIDDDIAHWSGQTTASLEISFTPPQYSVVFRNDLDGASQGDIIVNDSSCVSGSSVPLYWGDQVSVQAYGGKYQRSGESYMFHGWDQSFANIQNPRDYVVLDDRPVVAYFTPVYDVTVSNNFEGTSGGTIVYEGVQYSGSHTEQDVFRDFQRHFSTSSPQSDTISTWTFDRWDDGISNTSRTVDVTSTRTYNAIFKGHLRSTVQSSSGPNNQRKTGFVRNKHRMVYESSGEIWYCSSTDDGATWSTETRLSSGSGHSRQPSLAIRHQWEYPENELGVVWEDYDGTYSTIYVRRLQSSGEWTGAVQISSTSPYAGFSGATPGMIMENGFEAISWRVGTGDPYTSAGIYVWVSPDGYPVKVAGTGSSSSHPSIAAFAYQDIIGRFGIAWSDNGQIYYKRFWYNFDGEALNSVATECASSGSSFTDHAFPSLVFEGAYTERPVIAWQAYEGDFFYTQQILMRRRESGGWGTIQVYSKADDFLNPSLTRYEASSNLAVCWWDNSQNGIYLAKNTGSWGAKTTLNDEGYYPALGYDDSYNNNKFRIVYATGSPSPYWLGSTTQGLPKEGTRDLVFRRISRESKAGRWSVSIREGSLRSESGVSPLAFSPWDDSRVAMNEKGDSEFFRSDEFVPDNGTILSLEAVSRFEATDGSQVGKEMNAAVLEFSDARDGRVVHSETIGGEATQGSAGRSILSFDLSKLSGIPVRMSVRMPKEDDVVTCTNAIIYHDASANEQKPNLARSIVVADLPVAYQLLNAYPNPFNPSTRIDYSVPEDALIELKVFDVLGREVTTLQDGLKEPGYYAAEWHANGQASGMYLARLIARDMFGNLTYQGVTKLFLMK